MAVVYRVGDLFSSEAEVLGHGVNTQGVMGAGIARMFKNKFPKNYETYRKACKEGRLNPGDCLTVVDTRAIANIASQEFLGADAKLYLLQDGLTSALMSMQVMGFSSIALPRIGAGIGGLEWDEAKQVIEKVSEDFPSITVEVWSLLSAN